MTTNNVRALSSVEVVERYLSFFRTGGHAELPGSPIVVPGSSTSFIIAGMQPMLPYLRGQEQPPVPRLTSFQRCLRTDDADAVGINGKKLTCFHMLGNWSIGDYGKHDAIAMALDLLLNSFGLNAEKLWVTTFAGDAVLGVPADEVTIKEWLHVGIPGERIVPLGVDDNFWTMGGPGPCGPCSEIFVDRGEALGCGRPGCQPGCECERFIEIWNLVFIEYERLPDGSLAPLPLRSVDTGMGLERIGVVLQGAESVFSIDLFVPAMTRLTELATTDVVGSGRSEFRARRMIVDHTRAALFAGLAGVQPGREGRSSVVRRLIRRASRQGRVLGIDGPFLGELVMPLVQGHAGLLTLEERLRVPEVIRMLTEEEERFSRVLTIGLRHLAQLEPGEHGLVPGERLFELHAEKGFPSDLAAEVLAERGLQVDWLGYERALAEHREVSRLGYERRLGSA
jgi:alanyl-tRNA synthetase